MRSHWIIAALAVSALSAPAAAQDFNWRGRIGSGQIMEIKNVIGSVRAVAGTGTEVEVEAVKTGRKNDPDEVRIEVVPHANGVTICAVYPQGKSREPNNCQPGERGRTNANDNDVKINFVVRVPRNVDFTGRSVNGD